MGAIDITDGFLMRYNTKSSRSLPGASSPADGSFNRIRKGYFNSPAPGVNVTYSTRISPKKHQTTDQTGYLHNRLRWSADPGASPALERRTPSEHHDQQPEPPQRPSLRRPAGERHCGRPSGCG